MRHGCALIFLVMALIAAVLGFSGIAGAAASMAKLLFGLFLLLRAILIGLFAFRKVPDAVWATAL